LPLAAFLSTSHFSVLSVPSSFFFTLKPSPVASGLFSFSASLSFGVAYIDVTALPPSVWLNSTLCKLNHTATTHVSSIKNPSYYVCILYEASLSMLSCPSFFHHSFDRIFFSLVAFFHRSHPQPSIANVFSGRSNVIPGSSVSETQTQVPQ